MTVPAAYPGLALPVPRRTAVSQPRGILRVLVAGYVALMPYQFDTGAGMNFAPSDGFLLLILLLAAGQLKYVKPAWTVWHLAIALIFAAGSFVTAWRLGVLQPYELLNKDAGLVLPFLSYAAITSVVARWEDLRSILRVFTLGVVIENILAVGGFLAAYFFGVPNPFASFGVRLQGMLLDPNAYGGLLVAAFVICEGASWGREPLFKGVTLWVSRLTLALGILFTFSRSAWIAFAMALLVLGIIRTTVALRLVIGGLVAAPCLLLLLGPRFLDVFERMAKRPEQVEERFDLIQAALRIFAHNPFLGGGLGSFRATVGEIAHNSAMWFLADFGIVGLAVLLAFVGWFAVKAWFAYRFAPAQERPLVLALLLAHVAMFGLAMGIEAFYQRHWWLVFALIASSYSLVLSSQCRVGLRPAEPLPDGRGSVPSISRTEPRPSGSGHDFLLRCS